jgi:hypothetical protein
MKNIKTSLIVSVSLLLSTLVFLACGADPNATPASAVVAAPTPTDGSESAAQLAGSGQFCTVDSSLGSELGGMGNTHTLILSAGGTYTYETFFSDHTGCSTSTNSGGNDIATYSQSGTYAVAGTAGLSPAAITKIAFTMTSATMYVYAAGNTTAQAMATWMNGSCSPSPGFSLSATSGASLNGNTCVGSGSFNAVVLPISGGGISGSPNPFYNVGYNSVSTSLNMGARQDAWRPGGTTYPGSVTEAYLLW